MWPSCICILHWLLSLFLTRSSTDLEAPEALFSHGWVIWVYFSQGLGKHEFVFSPAQCHSSVHSCGFVSTKLIMNIMGKSKAQSSLYPCWSSWVFFHTEECTVEKGAFWLFPQYFPHSVIFFIKLVGLLLSSFYPLFWDLRFASNSLCSRGWPGASNPSALTSECYNGSVDLNPWFRPGWGLNSGFNEYWTRVLPTELHP